MHLETLEYTNTEYFFLPRQNANHFGKDIQSKHCMSITEHRERETVTNVFQTTRNTAFSKQHLWKRRSKRLYLITLPNNTCIYNECTWTHRHWFYDHRFAFCTDKLHFRLLLSRLIALLKDAEVLLAKWKETITFDWGRKWALPPGYIQMADPYCPGCCSSLTGQNFPGCMTAG